MKELNTLSSDIHSAAASLGALAGTVPVETWEYLRIVRRQLQASAEQVAHLEKVADISRQPIFVYVATPVCGMRQEHRHD